MVERFNTNVLAFAVSRILTLFNTNVLLLQLLELQLSINYSRLLGSPNSKGGHHYYNLGAASKTRWPCRFNHKARKANKVESFSAFMWVFSSPQSFVNIKQLIPILSIGGNDGFHECGPMLIAVGEVSPSRFCASKTWKPFHINEAHFYPHLSQVHERVAGMSKHRAF